jgi:hypothetical protein
MRPDVPMSVPTPSSLTTIGQAILSAKDGESWVTAGVNGWA